MRIKRPKDHHESYFTFPVLSSYRVIIVFTEDIGASVSYLGDRDMFNVHVEDKVDTCVACHLHPEGRGYSYVIFNPKAYAGAIAHECWHMVYNLMDFTGVRLEDEFVAYHLGYAVQKVVEFQHIVQRRTKNVDSGRRGSKAGTGRTRRSRRNGSES